MLGSTTTIRKTLVVLASTDTIRKTLAVSCMGPRATAGHAAPALGDRGGEHHRPPFANEASLGVVVAGKAPHLVVQAPGLSISGAGAAVVEPSHLLRTSGDACLAFHVPGLDGAAVQDNTEVGLPQLLTTPHLLFGEGLQALREALLDRRGGAAVGEVMYELGL